MGKAERAAVSARLLLEAGDIDGACNRAYYAMFDASRAALLISGAPVEAEVARTHIRLAQTGEADRVLAAAHEILKTRMKHADVLASPGTVRDYF